MARPIQFSISDATVQPAAYYPGGGIAAIMLGGADVDQRSCSGGQIGANIALRDTTLPTDQAELDEFAQNLASRFDAQGLTLFTDPTGAVPAGGRRRCRPAMSASPASSRSTRPCWPIRRWCATAIHRSIRRHPVTRLAGFTDVINRVLEQRVGLGARRRGAANVTRARTGGHAERALCRACHAGPARRDRWSLRRRRTAPATTTQLDTEQAVQTTLTGKLSAQSGVNMDTEMSTMIQLQNAYGANAKIIAAVQAMWTQLLAIGAVRRRAMSGSIGMTGVADYGMLSSLIPDSQTMSRSSTS